MKSKNNFQTAIQELISGNLGSNPSEKATQTENTIPLNVKPGHSDEKREEDPKIQLELSPTPSFISPTTQVESIISSDMVIEGSITTGSNIKLYGKVKGNISAKGDILVSKGVVAGEVKGINLTLNNSQIEGNITAVDMLIIDNASIVVGNLSANSAELNGKIKGNIYTQNTATFKADTLLLGDVKAKSISVENGATLKGNFDVSSENISAEYFDLYSLEI